MSPAPHSLALALDEFVSDADLRALLDRGMARRHGGLLTTADDRKYVLREAVRVIGSASGDTDPYGFVGLTDTIRALLERGFVMSAERVAFGRRVYNVEYGWLAEPIASADRSGINPRVG
jgi:hypothetical protein